MAGKNGVEFLMEVNRQNSEEFVREQDRRWLYRKIHSTEIAALKCMDGRLNLSLMTETPLGIIQPYRNIGGKFSLGWYPFQQAIHGWKKYADSKLRDSVVLVTYHFSRGDTHRGCKGHNYDTEAAKAFSKGLKDQFDKVYNQAKEAQRRTRLFSIQVGIETDFEALILHGENGQVIDLAEHHDASEEGIKKLLESLYPSIATASPNVIYDLIPLIKGNISHIAKIRSSSRMPQELDHKEWILAIGRGFDWLHLPNAALIVGPWQNDLAGPIQIAAGLINKNFESGATDGQKPVLLTSGTYRDDMEEKVLAELKSQYWRDVTVDIIKNNFKNLYDNMEVMTTTVDLNTRTVNIIK